MNTLKAFAGALFLFVLSQSVLTQKRNYITGDAFRACADYIVEKTTSAFKPEEVKAKSIVFVEVDSLGYFFKTIFPRINVPIILISHNGDMPAPGAYVGYLDDARLIAWFGQNCDSLDNPKFVPIPIGLGNAKWPHGDQAVFDQFLDTLERLRRQEHKKQLYINFSPTTNYIRIQLHQLLGGQPFASFVSMKKLPAYLKEMSSYRYTLSPFGNGLDCHRTWEALLVGSIPVVKTSTIDPLYDGLPVIILQNWHELTPELLEKKYQELQDKQLNRKKMFMDYWVALIKQYQQG